nr:hypothetical protein [Halobacterium hubeiense]
MASYTTIEDWRDVKDGYVIDVTIRQTEDNKYPSGWDYGLHLGEVGATPSSATTTLTNGRKATNATPRIPSK